MEYVALIGGLIILIISGELLIRGAVGIALKFNIPTLIIGMTIISMGTSAPELLVSLKVALNGHSELAIGNVVGSNVANIALVLGLTTMILPITVKRSTAFFDWPIMMSATVLFYFFILNGRIEWYEGLIFTIGLIAFNIYMFKSAKKISKEVRIMDEIRQQLATQMNKLGKPGYYNQEHTLAIKLKVCKRMREEFQKERDNLQYQKD